jgi:3D (Asp-Asp-Asp) domain-containing protein
MGWGAFVKRATWRVLIGAIALAVGGCYLLTLRSRVAAPGRAPDRIVAMEVTGYCPCGECCGWERTWYGKPVIASGPNKGERKRIGITASGTRARPGTMAADASLYPFGTVLRVPGYGLGRVEDRGGAIRGNRLDLFFKDHQEALRWGRQTLRVEVWFPTD